MLKLEDRCKLEMESHKQLLDKEYETLLQQFSKELEKLQIKHQQDLEKKVLFNFIIIIVLVNIKINYILYNCIVRYSLQLFKSY